MDSLYADTTGDKFMWLIAYMMRYREVLAKCREEMDKVYPHIYNAFTIDKKWG